MRKLANFLTDNLSYVFFVLAAGWAIGFAAWAIDHLDLLQNFLLTNQLPPELRSTLLWLVIAGPALALVLWVTLGVVAAATRRPAGLVMQQAATLALPLTLVAFLPILSLKTLVTERPFLVFFFVAVMAGITFVTVNRASRLLPASDSGLRGAVPANVPILERSSAFGVGLVVVCGLALGYIVFMSVLTVARHNAFMTHSFDLGIHDQVVYNALHHGVLRSTQHEPRPINYLGNHFAPILFLVAPLYLLKQDARTLLVLQSLMLGLGAVPIYLLAQEKLRSSALAIALSASYLLFPALHGINTFDFHQIALVTSLLLWSLYFLETGRTKLFLLFLILAAATKEEVALTVAAFGIYLFLVKQRYRLGTALTIGGVVYFVLVVGYAMPALGGVPQVDRFGGLMAEGTHGLAAVVTTLLTNPTYALLYIFGDPRKIEFLCLLLLPVLFLPVLAGRSLILAIPAFSVALLASAEENFSIGTQYPAIMIPFVSFLAIVAIQRLDARRLPVLSPGPRGGARAGRPGRGTRAALAVTILTASLATNYEYGWLFGRLFTGIPQPTSHDRVVTSFFSQIPATASVSTVSDLVPHLTARDTIYLFPMTEHADYILFDAYPKANFWPYISRNAREEATRLLAPYLISGEYGVARADDWVLLLKRGQDINQNVAALRLLFSSEFEAEDLSSDFTSPPERDSQASGGYARVGDWSLPHAEGRSGLTYGPYASLLPGKYRVTYRLKLDGPTTPHEARDSAPADAARQGRVATVDIFSTAMGGALAGEDLMAKDFRTPGAYEEFAIDVEIPRALDDVEYRVLYAGPERLWADVIKVTPIRAIVPVATYEAEELPGDSEVVADAEASNGAARASKVLAGGDVGPRTLVYGSFPQTTRDFAPQTARDFAPQTARDFAASLMPGRYRATFALKLRGTAPQTARDSATPGDNAVNDAGLRVATVDVYSKSAGGPLASLDINASDFKALDAYQDFTLDFQTSSRWNDIEYRVLSQGQSSVSVDYVQVSYLLSE